MYIPYALLYSFCRPKYYCSLFSLYSNIVIVFFLNSDNNIFESVFIYLWLICWLRLCQHFRERYFDSIKVLNNKKINPTYVLHSELLGARNSNICDVFVLIKKNEFLSAASWRTNVSESMLIMGLTGLLLTSVLRAACKYFNEYLSS